MRIRKNIGSGGIVGNKVLIIIVFLILIVTIHVTLATTGPSYDTAQDCRACHGSNTSTTIPKPADRHHALVYNGNIGCADCHPNNSSGVQEITWDCLVCHPGKNHTNVHHNLAHVCTDCHPVVYDDQTDTYYTQITRDCPVCHSTVLSRPST